MFRKRVRLSGIRSAYAVCAAAALALGSAACSPSAFFGDDEDKSVTEMPKYREINQACSGLDLSEPTLDIPAFKNLLGCFNSNGGLQPIWELVQLLDDEDLQPLVDVANKYVLNNQRLLYHLESTYYTLARRGTLLDDAFFQLGRLLENKEFVAASLAVLNETVQQESPEGGGRRRPDPLLLKAIERFATKVNVESIDKGLRAGLALASAPAFSSLKENFGSGPTLPDSRLRELTDAGVAYLRDVKGGRFDAVEALIRHIQSGILYSAIDDHQMLGTSVGQFIERVPRLSSVLKAMLADDGRVMDGLTTLFHDLNGPIHCLKESQSVSNGVMWALRELKLVNLVDAVEFIKRDNAMTIALMKPFCNYPAGLANHYADLARLADYKYVTPSEEDIRVAVPMVETIKVLFRYTQGGSPVLINTMVSLLADNNGAGAPAGFKHMVPILAELDRRRVWDDGILLLALLRPQDRDELSEILDFLTEDVEELGGQSIYDILTDKLSRASSESVFRLVKSMGPFVNSRSDLLMPALTALREAMHVNDVHPLVEILEDIMATASETEPLFNTVFKITSEVKYRQKFMESVELVSDMAKDGRLKQLVGSTVTLFHKFAVAGKDREIAETRAPVFDPSSLRRHELAARNLWYSSDPSRGDVIFHEIPQYKSCNSMDLSFSLDEYSSPNYDRHLNHLLGCINSDDAHQPVVDAVNYLRSELTEDGRSFFNLQIDLIKELGRDLNRDELRDLVNRVMKEKGPFQRLLDGLDIAKHWFITPVGEAGGDIGPAVRPALDLVEPVLRRRPELKTLQNFSADVVLRNDFPHLVSYVDDLLQIEQEPDLSEHFDDFDWERIKRWVHNKECNWDPRRGRNALEEERRAEEIINDFTRGLTGWDLVDGEARKHWPDTEFKERVEPLLQKFSDASHSNPERHVLDALLNVMRYFSLRPGERVSNRAHYTPEYLKDWLWDRANDYKLITYFYPGETEPRVRLVNSLDRLELVLVNADLKFLMPENFGMKFLAQIGHAWGDEHKDVWPREIQEQFPNCPADPARRTKEDRCPQNLRAAFEDIQSTSRLFERVIGFPRLPGCPQLADPRDPEDVRRGETTDPRSPGGTPDTLVPFNVKASLYNIRQVLGVVEENLPDSGTRHAGGMKVLRDLFFELYYSTPAEYRNPKAGWRNNLSVIVRMVRLGVLRQASNKLRTMDRDDPSLLDLIRGLVAGAASPKVRPVLDDLLKTDRHHELIWKIMGEIFQILDAPSAPMNELKPWRRELLVGASPYEERRIREEWALEAARLKQMVYYLLSSVPQLGMLYNGDINGLVDPTLVVAHEILGNPDFHSYLTDNADRIESLLREKSISYLMRAIYEDDSRVALPDGRSVRRKAMLADLLHQALADPRVSVAGLEIIKTVDLDEGGKAAWNLFVDRVEALSEYPEYKSLDARALFRSVLNFLKEDESIDCRNRNYGPPGRNYHACKLRHYLAQRLNPALAPRGPNQPPADSSDIEQILVLIRRDPNRFYQLLATVGEHVRNREIIDFAKLARRSLYDLEE